MLLEIFSFLVWIYRHLTTFLIGSFLRLRNGNKPREKIPPIRNGILLLSATDLSGKIRTKKLTATSIMEAYIDRVKEVNPIINAVVEDRFQSAMEEAKAVDRFIANDELSVDELEGKFPLLGVPFSVKESIAVAGFSNNAGLKNAGRKAKEDAEVIKLLRGAGAIPFVVSNTPELCLNFETYNTDTGRTLNPYDTHRTPGGSSGGEAALLASACSVIGIGSDVAGSLRLPAHFCGIWSHKPSPGLVSTQGHFPDCIDTKHWQRIFTMGPMCRYSSDLPLLLRIMRNPSAVVKTRYIEKVDFSKIKVFYMEHNGGKLSRRANPEIVAAIRKTAVHFRNNHKTQIQNMHSKLLNFLTLFALVDMLSINDIDDIFDKNSSRSAIAELIRSFFRKSNFHFMSITFVLIQKILHFISYDWKKIRQKEVEEKFRSKLGNNGVLIYPVFPEPAHKHYEIFIHLPDVFYMMIFNYLGVPVTTCPVGFDKSGLPLGIQVVANRNCDRLSLAVAQEIEKLFGGWSSPDNQIDTT